MDKINLEALHYYLSYKYVPTPLSMFKGRYRKPILDVSGIKFAPPIELSEEDIVDKLDEILRKEMAKRMGGNVGFFLSGGLDSSVPVAISAEMSSKPIQTFTLAYREDDETDGKRSDREYARIISKLFGTKHHEFYISFDDCVKENANIIKCIGEPFSCYVSEYFLSRCAKKYIDIALTGDWADELFGSYRTHRLAYQNHNVDTCELRYSMALFNDEEKQELYSKDIRQKMQGYSTLEHIKQSSGKLSAEDSLNRMLESEIKTFFVDSTFESIVKLSKLHSLEVVGVYSFPEFASFAARIPGGLKIKEGETKYILKQLALRYLPREIIYRPKEGFTIPTLNLVRSQRGYVNDILSPDNLKIHNLFDIEYVQNLVDDFYKAETEIKSYRIWNLVCFQVWYNLFIK